MAERLHTQSVCKQCKKAFTLLEVLVAVTVLVIIMTAILSLTSATGRAWKDSNAKVEAFRSARIAFDNLTRRLGQATLNTYWDYDPPAGNANGEPPKRYIRQSELHFVSGKELINDQVGHAVFFQSPEGVVDDTVAYGGLEDLLNACGYFIQFGSDPNVPPFMTTLLPDRYRYRLMEYVEPSENLRVYNTNPQDSDYMSWFRLPANPPNARVLAENIIALVIEPRLAKGDAVSGSELAPDFEYDSRLNVLDDPQPATANQLPPVIHVTMVAIDEAAAARLEQESGSTSPNLGFSHSAVLQNNSQSNGESKLDQDVETIEAALISRKIKYRVFRTDVVVRSAKWSEQ